MRLDGNRDGLIRTQWCHGAPGIVATLAPFLDEEPAVAGELTWRGAAAEGRGLCHGTAGNGYAFLALLERTGDERWLARAGIRDARGGPVEHPGGVRPRPLHALDGRPRHRPLPRGLRRGRRPAPAPVGAR